MPKIIADDGNEEYCGACRKEGVLLCCENCPAAYHFGCAGYVGEGDVPGGEEDAWLCWGCSQKTQTPFLHSTKPLEKAVGNDVRVASKDGSIEYHRAIVVGGNAATLDVVYEDLPGVRESIDSHSRRLWHGTLNEDSWERRGIKYVPISRAYTIDIDRTSGSPAGKQPGKQDARSTASAAAAWQEQKPAAAGRPEAESKTAQAQGKKAAQQPAPKKGLGGPGLPAVQWAQSAAGATRRSNTPPIKRPATTTERPKASAGTAAKANAPSRKPPASSAQQSQASAAGTVKTDAPTKKQPAPSAERPQASAGTAGKAVVPSSKQPASSAERSQAASASTASKANVPPAKQAPSAQRSQASAGGAGTAGAHSSKEPDPFLPRTQASVSAAGKPEAQPSKQSAPSMERPQASAGGVSKGDAPATKRSAPSAAAAAAPKRPRTLPLSQPGGPSPPPPSTVASPTRPPLPRAPPPPPTSSRPSSAPAASRASVATSGASKMAPRPLPPGNASATAVRQPLPAVQRGGNAPPWPLPASHAAAPPRAPLQPNSYMIPQVAPPSFAAGTGMPPLLQSSAVEVDVHDMQRPFLDPASLGALADVSEWGVEMDLENPDSQVGVGQEIKTEMGSAAEDAPTATPAATPEISTAEGAFECADADEAAFTAALEAYLDSKKKTMYQPRIQQKPISASQLWNLVTKAGGSEAVTSNKGWARIARAVGAPDSMTDKSTVTKRVFQLCLGDFEEATKRGETDLAVQRDWAATATPPPQPRQQRNRGGRSSPSRKRARASGRAAERRVIGWVQVNKEHALDVGAVVEVRSHDKQHTGGWMRARILQVCPGSLWEGGLRFEVELEDITAPSTGRAEERERPASAEEEEAAEEKMEAAGKERGWVPLVHARANTEVPAVLIRQPLQPATPPTPITQWRTGERVEGYWEEGGSWWPATLESILPDGDELEIRVDPTPAYRDGELWVLPTEQVRRGPSSEREGFGLLEPLQEEQWTTAGDLRRKLGWQQHAVDGWAIEVYATQATFPRAPSEAAGSPPSRLHSTNRKGPAPDPLASLEEAAARVLGRTLSAATPRAESAAAGLLDLAPSGRRWGPFSSAPGSPSVESASQEEAFLDTASGDDTETGRVTKQARTGQKTTSRLALPPLVSMSGLSCDEALEEDSRHAQLQAGAEQSPGRSGKAKKPGLKGKQWAPPPGPWPPWQCPMATPAAFVDPEYPARLQAGMEASSKTPKVKSPAKGGAKGAASALAPRGAQAKPERSKPDKLSASSAPTSAPAKVYHWPVKMPRGLGGTKQAAFSKGTQESKPAAAADPGRAHLKDTPALKSAHRHAPDSHLPKWGQGSSRTLPSKQAAGAGQDARPGSAAGNRAAPQGASGPRVMGRPIGLAESLPGVRLSGLPASEQAERVLAHLLQSAAGQPASSPAASCPLPYRLVPLPADLPAQQQSPQRQPPLPRPLPVSAPASSSLPALRGGRLTGPAVPASAAPPPYRAGVSPPSLPAFGRQPGPARVVGQVVSSLAPGMYSQPAVAMRSLLTSASELLGRARVAKERPMPALVSMPLGLQPTPPGLLPHASLSSSDIQRAAESIAQSGAAAGVGSRPPLPAGLAGVLQQPRAPFTAGLQVSAGERPTEALTPAAAAAAAPSGDSRYPRIMPLGAAAESTRYPKIQFSMALPPLTFPAQSPHANGTALPQARGGNALSAAPLQTAGASVADVPRQLPMSSRLVAALSQSLLCMEPAAAQQLPPPQTKREGAKQAPRNAPGRSQPDSNGHSWPSIGTNGAAGKET